MADDISDDEKFKKNVSNIITSIKSMDGCNKFEDVSNAINLLYYNKEKLENNKN